MAHQRPSQFIYSLLVEDHALLWRVLCRDGAALLLAAIAQRIKIRVTQISQSNLPDYTPTKYGIK